MGSHQGSEWIDEFHQMIQVSVSLDRKSFLFETPEFHVISTETG